MITDGGPPPYATTFLPLFIYRNGFEYLRFGYAAAATVVMLGADGRAPRRPVRRAAPVAPRPHRLTGSDARLDKCANMCSWSG